SVRKPEVQLRVGRVERTAGQARGGGEGLDQVHQFVVVFGGRLAEHLPAVGVAEEYPVAAIDVDVLDLLVLEQRLQSAHPEQRRVDSRREFFLLLRVGGGPACGDLASCVIFEDLGDQGAGELPLI